MVPMSRERVEDQAVARRRKEEPFARGTCGLEEEKKGGEGGKRFP